MSGAARLMARTEKPTPAQVSASVGNSPWRDGQRGVEPWRGEPIRWFAVYTAARAEGEVAARLDPVRPLGEATRFQVFYPQIKVGFRRGRKREYVEVARPYFPRYLFVGIRTSDSFGGAVAAINATIGVSTVVHLNGNPLEIPPCVMAELMEQAGSCELMSSIGLPKETARFEGQVGDHVKLSSETPFGGFVCEITSLARLDAHGEIGIWLNLLGAEREVYWPASKIGKIVK